MDLDQNEVEMLFYITLALMAVGAIMMFRMMSALSKNQTTHHLKVKQLNMEREMGELIARNSARELTFMEIKRELHDNVKPLLTISNMNMEGLLPMLTEAQQEKLLPAIEGNEKAMEHVDDLSLAINSDWLKGLGLVNALDQEIEKLRKAGVYEIETAISRHQVAMDRDRELLIFRIVQEAVSNIIKHASATKITFLIQYGQDRAVFTITDNGKGIDSTAQAGKNTRMGMSNMRSRAQILQAQFNIETAPGKGTSINLVVPYNTKHN